MMEIVAVVVTYNRKKLLIECIEAILNQTYKISKIIIIDNNSTDGTFEELQKNNLLGNNHIIYEKLDKNIGGAGGFYTGIKKSLEFNPDYVWIMDDDTIPTENSLEKLVNSITFLKLNKEKFSFLASAVFGENGEVMNVPTLDSSSSKNGYPNWYIHLSNGIVKIKTATFVSLLFDVNAIKKCGLPCKNFFIWGDDTEYTTRLTKNYAPAFMIGESVVIHKRKNAKVLDITDEDNVNRINMFYYKYRNELIVMEEYYGKKKAIKMILENMKQIFIILIMKNIKYKLKKIFIILKGINAFIFKTYGRKEFTQRFIIKN